MEGRVVGLDGTKSGWVAVVLAGGCFAEAAAYETLAGALDANREALAFGVDMPTALPRVGGTRPAELEARRLLGPRCHSVFLSHPSAVLDAETYADPMSACRSLKTPGISRQAYGLRAKIHEAIAAARDSRVVEVHPELSFWALANREPLAHSKKDWNGHHARRALLEAVGIFVPQVLSGPAGRAAVDDVLDAAAAAWTAWRRSTGLACRLPAGDPDPDGGSIWY